MDAAHKIVALRKTLGNISQSELARRLNVKPMSVSRWEAGGEVSRKHQIALAQLAGTSVAEFFHGDEIDVFMDELEAHVMAFFARKRAERKRR
jgi:transcriptional regulator with XRE-family HTH domain